MNVLVFPPSDSCPGVVANFEGKQGVFISGQILPTLADVSVTITDQRNADLTITMVTDAQGTFR